MMAEFQMVPIGLLRESKTNPRRTFAGMDELVASVKLHGVLTPLLVRHILVSAPASAPPEANARQKGYEIVAGARRYRAAKACDLEWVPVTIRELTDAQALELQIVENLQREDVHPLDEAQGYKALMESSKADVAAIAKRVGKSASYVYQRLKLLDLGPEAQQAFAEGKLTAGHAVMVARLPEVRQKEAVKQIAEENPSVRQLAKTARKRPLDQAETKLSFNATSNVRWVIVNPLLIRRCFLAPMREAIQDAVNRHQKRAEKLVGGILVGTAVGRQTQNKAKKGRPRKKLHTDVKPKKRGAKRKH